MVVVEFFVSGRPFLLEFPYAMEPPRVVSIASKIAYQSTTWYAFEFADCRVFRLPRALADLWGWAELPDLEIFPTHVGNINVNHVR